ncbi:MAG: NAD(P)H-dependent oxidoreductase [Anaerolineae bacterium]|nr:NAD(P)H-dependent oxidoreductase [Anaerolineae bacterium]
MKITCISASNIEIAKQHSASTRVCKLIREIILARYPENVDVQILPLIDCELTPCRMCGSCFESGRCVRDEAYNDLFRQLEGADRIFIVCPHYATIPSKLVMLLEKFQEIVYLRSCADPTYRFPLSQKPVGIIVHGGQTEEALPYFKKALLDPLAAALASAQMQIIGVDAEWPNGVAFGISRLYKPEDSIFVTIEHDWEAIRRRVEPLVENVMAAEAGC